MNKIMKTIQELKQQKKNQIKEITQQSKNQLKIERGQIEAEFKQQIKQIKEQQKRDKKQQKDEQKIIRQQQKIQKCVDKKINSEFQKIITKSDCLIEQGQEFITEEIKSKMINYYQSKIEQLMGTNELIIQDDESEQDEQFDIELMANGMIIEEQQVDEVDQQADEQVDEQVDEQIDEQVDEQIDEQVDEQIDEQVDEQIDEVDQQIICLCKQDFKKCISGEHECLCLIKNDFISKQCKSKKCNCVCLQKGRLSCKSCPITSDDRKIKCGCQNGKNKCQRRLILKHDCICNVTHQTDFFYGINNCKSDSHACVCHCDYKYKNCKSHIHQCLCEQKNGGRCKSLHSDTKICVCIHGKQCNAVSHKCVCKQGYSCRIKENCLLVKNCKLTGKICTAHQHACICPDKKNNEFICKQEIYHYCICSRLSQCIKYDEHDGLSYYQCHQNRMGQSIPNNCFDEKSCRDKNHQKCKCEQNPTKCSVGLHRLKHLQIIYQRQALEKILFQKGFRQYVVNDIQYLDQ